MDNDIKNAIREEGILGLEDRLSREEILGLLYTHLTWLAGLGCFELIEWEDFDEKAAEPWFWKYGDLVVEMGIEALEARETY